MSWRRPASLTSKRSTTRSSGFSTSSCRRPVVCGKRLGLPFAPPAAEGLDSLDLEPVAFRLAEELERLEAATLLAPARGGLCRDVLLQAMPEVYKKAKKTLMMDSAAQPGVRQSW